MSTPNLNRRDLLGLAGTLALAASPGSAWSQPRWPTRPITIVVPFTPGTGIDVIARAIAPKLHERLGQAVIVENKPGASGTIGFGFVANSAPDGHTLLLTANGFVISPSLIKNVPYDPVRSFVPIALTATGALALAVHPAFPAKTLKEAVQLFKSNPGKYSYASPGNSTPHHLAMELFKINTGTSIVHIPYKGTAGAFTDLIGGQVQAMIVGVHVAMPHVKAGRLRMLAVAQQERVANAPDMPTFTEEGVRNSDVDLWYGLLAPAGTPPAVVTLLNQQVNEILALPDVRASLAGQGLDPIQKPPQVLADLIARDLVRWADVIRKANITAD
jgi:tripartite-type tricarboxylate transporter receptor subunit TctC